ncbi:MAG: hypothetical protein Q9227_005853 [Pyrenula ochraceoflavens]
MELMVVVSASKFLLRQHELGRISADSVSKATTMWKSKNRPQVIDFQFDQATQRDIIQDNLLTLRFEGEYETNLVLLKSTLHQWKSLAKDMSVRTFCSPDSMIRQNLFDTSRVIEMLGAPQVMVLAWQELFGRTMGTMQMAAKRRMERKMQLGTPKEVPLPPPSPLSAFHQSLGRRDTLWEDPSEN